MKTKLYWRRRAREVKMYPFSLLNRGVNTGSIPRSLLRECASEASPDNTSGLAPRNPYFFSKIALIFLLFLVVFSVPAFSYAANLIPCNNTFDQSTGRFSDPCDFAKLVTLGNNIINFLWSKFALPFAVILFMWAGFLFMFKSENSG